VEYFDSGSGSFHVQYDGSDPNAPFQGAYTASSQSVTLTGTDQWKSARFRLLAARFLNSQNGGADLRIATGINALHIHRIIVRRLGLPDEAGADMPGWQDDFTGDFEANWEIAISADPAFLSTRGLLSIRHAQPAPTRALTSSIDEATDVELLARMRVKAAPAPGSLGGLLLGATSDPQSGFHFQFIKGSNNISRIALDGPGLHGAPSAMFGWDTNLWYWLRLRHQTNLLTGYPDLWARIWPADGETPEPVAWNLYWDYFPNHTARRGRPGFVSGTVLGGALECDYLLVKRHDLPLITAILPQLKPARPHLAAVHFSEESGFHLTLDGDPDVHWILESSTNLHTWTDITSLWSAADPIAWNHLDATTSTRRFYRVRYSP
jgi:hypothetical protein